MGQTDSYMGRRDLYTWGKQTHTWGEETYIHVANRPITWGEETYIHGANRPIHGAKRLIYMWQTDPLHGAKRLIYMGQTDPYMGRRDLYTWGKQTHTWGEETYIHGAKRLIYMGQTDPYMGEQPKCGLKTEIAHSRKHARGESITLVDIKSIWKDLFKNIPRLSIDNKLRQLSFKPLHRILVTNYYELQRFNISVDECIYCRSRNSIQHAFLEFFVGLSLSQEMIRMV